MKKFLSLFLSIVMLFSITTGVNLTASAADYYERESNDSFYSADNLPINSSISGNCAYGSVDYDYFKITTNKNGKLNIKFSHDKIDSDYCWTIYIYKKENDEYKQMTYKTVAASNADYSFATIGAMADSTYYIRVSIGNSYIKNLNYTLSNTFKATESYEKEYNNSFFSANTLNLNSTISGNMATWDYDYYKIPVNNSCRLSIKFAHDKKDTNYSWIVYIYKKVDDGYKQIDYKVIDTTDSDYTFATINASKSNYYVKVRVDNYAIEKLNYTISAKEVKDTNVTVKLNRNTFTTNGKVQRPSVTVYDSKGKKLEYKKDFTVEYSNWSSKNVGRYTVTVKMIGNYGGTKTFPYYINPKPTEFVPSNKGGFKAISKGFTLKWNKQASQTTGYQIQYATKRDFSNAATITIANPNTTSKTIKGRAGNTRYYVRVRTYKKIGSGTFYSNWNSGVKSVVTLR